jgi:hypothetical protein
MPVLRPAVLAAFSILFSGSALAGEWTISKIAGRGYLVSTINAAPELAAEGQIVPAGVTLATGIGSRAIITDGKTVMAVGPETNVKITQNGPMTSVQQASGSIGLDVETLGKPHLTVKTPFLAAVVKGTNFSVTVGKDSAEVSVSHGVVGVTDAKSGKRADVTSGQSASAGATGMSIGKSVGSKASASLSAQAADAKAAGANTEKGKANENSEKGKANAEKGKANAGPGKASAGPGKGKAGKGAGNAGGNSGNSGNGAGNSGGNGNSGGSTGGGAGSGGGSKGKSKGKGRGGKK